MHDEQAKPNDPTVSSAPLSQGHAEPREEQSNMMMDDINIPVVAIGVAFFGVLLAVTIISLQAWFYNYQASERQSKTLAQEDPRTDLGKLLEDQRRELHVGLDARRPSSIIPVATRPASVPAAGAASAPGDAAEGAGQLDTH